MKDAVRFSPCQNATHLDSDAFRFRVEAGSVGIGEVEGPLLGEQLETETSFEWTVRIA